MKPNIVVFVTDQHRADWLSCMGNDILRTPHIDSIAEKGTAFTRAYCNTPLCMPSRLTMWNGLPASAHGLRTNGVDPDDRFPTLPGILGENGYRTISVGKLHLRPWHLTPERSPNVPGYDPDELPECETVWKRGLRTKMPENYFGLDAVHFLGGHGGYCFGEYVNWLLEKHPEAHRRLMERESDRPSTRPWDNYYSTVPNELYYNEWIKDLSIQEIDASAEQPFFLWCSFPDPHFPFGPPKPYCDMYRPEDLPRPIAWDDDRAGMNELYHLGYYKDRGVKSLDGGPTELTLEQIQETKALAWGLVNSVDDSVGAVLSHLEATGKLDNTVVVFLADHGELMGDHGLFCKGPFHYEGLLRVPLIVRLPGQKEAIRSDAMASILDFMPTILDLAGADYPAPPIPDWKGADEGTDIYEGVRRLPGKSLRPILEGKAESVQDSILIENDDDVRGVNLRTLVTPEHKLTVYGGRTYGDLFDLVSDPEERNNLWASPEHQALKARLIERLTQEMIAKQPRLKHRYGVA